VIEIRRRRAGRRGRAGPCRRTLADRCRRRWGMRTRLATVSGPERRGGAL